MRRQVKKCNASSPQMSSITLGIVYIGIVRIRDPSESSHDPVPDMSTISPHGRFENEYSRGIE